MLKFTLMQRSKMLAFPGASSKIAEVVSDGGYSKPFVVFDKGVKSLGIADRVLSALRSAGIAFEEFSGVVPDPPCDVVDSAAAACRSSGCDCVIAIGGGSSIDVAKGVSVLRFNGGGILDYADPSVPMARCPGLISVPTTAGTGSELSNGIIITDPRTGSKVPIVGDKAMSEYVILDPELTLGMPPGLTAMTGLDVFSHALEAYTTVLAGPMTDIVCEKLMQDVAEFLPRAVADGGDLEARQRMLCCASLGGWMLANCCAHVGHSLAHVIGARFHVPHGAACAYACPAMMRFIAPAAPEKVRRAGEILGARFDGSEGPAEIAEKSAEAYSRFCEGLGLQPASELGISRDAAAALAREVSEECFAGLTPRKVSEADARAMLEDVFG
ncbi:MAG: iron-containing alcohol dehydrogenase [Candidatus Methanoplasma sp.]|jgi:alcohol dehydrogenase class IV|nr:iron-containing alcohol dehydrogenase [Candidatus Methanoplasma sp.]